MKLAAGAAWPGVVTAKLTSAAVAGGPTFGFAANKFEAEGITNLQVPPAAISQGAAPRVTVPTKAVAAVINDPAHCAVATPAALTLKKLTAAPGAAVTANTGTAPAAGTDEVMVITLPAASAAVVVPVSSYVVGTTPGVRGEMFVAPLAIGPI